jgi:hypothetical protein
MKWKKEMNTCAPINRSKLRSSFYTWVAVGIFLVIFAGFAHTYYLKFLFGTRALPLLLHLHGLIFTLWFALFFIQVRLVARHRVDLQRHLGIIGAVLAPLAAGVAIAVSFHAGRRSYLANPNSLTMNLRPLALDFGSSLTFVFLVAVGLYFRRRGDIHKRVMVLASCALLLPAVGRFLELIPLRFFQAGGLWEMVGFTEITPIVCIVYDTVVSPRIYGHREHPSVAQFRNVAVEPMTGNPRSWEEKHRELRKSIRLMVI